MRIWQGDKQEFFVKLTDQNGVPMTLTGLTFQAVMRPAPGDPVSFAFTCSIVADPAGGQRVRVYMPTSVSTTIPAGDYVWNFQSVEPGGDARTYLAGDVEVLAQVD